MSQSHLFALPHGMEEGGRVGVDIEKRRSLREDPTWTGAAVERRPLTDRTQKLDGKESFKSQLIRRSLDGRHRHAGWD